MARDSVLLIYLFPWFMFFCFADVFNSTVQGRQRVFMLPIPILVLASGTLLTRIGVARRQERPFLIDVLCPQQPTSRSDDPRQVSSVLSPLYKLGADIHSGVKTRRELLFGDQRTQQMQEFRSSRDSLNDPEHRDERAAEEAHLNHHFWVASTGTAIAVTGLVTHTALGPLSIPFTLYTCVPLVQVVYRGITEEKRLRGPVVDLVAIVASLSAHYYTLTAVSCALMCAAEKLVYRTQDRSHRDMVGVFQQQQQQVWLLRDTLEVEVPLADLQPGDIIVIHAGGVIPVDGVITQGGATIDQHMLTGEAQPVEKGVGDPVLAATLLLTGHIQVCVEKAGNATIMAQIGAVMGEIEDYRERQELRCDKTADRLVLPTLTAGFLTLVRLGRMSAVTVVGANFTETLRIAYPLGALSYLNLAAQRGILVKDGRALEMLSQVDTVVFDKTGTLTLEQPHVAVLHPCPGTSEKQLLTYAAAAEFRQTHPIARAILEAASQRQLRVPPIEEAAYAVGYGIKVRVANYELNGSPLIRVGSARYMVQEGITLSDAIQALQVRCDAQGHSLVYVAVDEQLAGTLELHATIRPEVQALVQQLRQRSLKLYIISGDRAQPTQQLAESLDMDGYFAEVLPADKAKYVEKLQDEGRKVCFIGDGINDAIALKQADVSISLRGATTVATDIAQIILMDQSLGQLDHLFDLAHQLNANLKRSFAAMIIPSCINLGGALFFRFGIRSAIVLFNASLLAGVANGLAPMLTGKKLSISSQQSPIAKPQAAIAIQPVTIPLFPHFKRLEVSDRAEIEGFVRQFPPYSQLSFPSLLAYDIADDTEVCWLHGNLVVRLLDFYTMCHFYSFLGVRQVADTIQQLLTQAQQEGITTQLMIVPEACLRPQWHELNQQFTICEDRACFDYILATAALCQLDVDTSQPKAKDLHKFLRKYPGVVVKEINLCQPAIQEQVQLLFSIWADKRQKEAEGTAVEATAIERLLRFAPHLALVTVGVYIADRLVAFTINEVVQDGYYIGHFGKSDPDYRGLGLYMEWATAKLMAQAGCQYMNYEEDLGSLGLRAYKESLQPIGYLKKYTISANLKT